MKNLIFTSLVLFSLMSCQKTNNLTIENSVGFRNSGVIPDPPELKRNFDIKVSKEFLEHGRTVAFNKFGKKIVDMNADDAESLMMSQARGGKKWGQGGSSGGSTGGGVINPTPSDYTPPRIIGVEPFQGTVYTLNGAWMGISLRAVIDDETKLVRVQVSVRGDILIDSTTGLKSGYGNWNQFDIPYRFPYGDGTYNMTWKAWDSTGNVTIVNSVFSRNTEFTVVPTDMPSSFVLLYPRNPYASQGGEGSCAAVTVNSAFTIQKYVRGGLTGGYNDNNVYSPEWIYNIGKGSGGCGSGSGVLSNMGIVVNRGVPTWAVLPYSSMNGCDTSIFTDAIRANAALNKGIWGFNTATADINAIKYNVYRGYVGVFAYQLDRQLINNPSPGYIWNFPHFQDGGPHAGCIIGYDDSKHAFLMLNSWGDSWADQNTVWIDYDFFWQAVTGGIYYFGN